MNKHFLKYSELNENRIINSYNFFEDTVANFEEIKRVDFDKNYKGLTVDFNSKSGSRYIYLEDRVIRLSNHFIKGVRSCDWFLNKKEYNERDILKIGECKYEDFIYKITPNFKEVYIMDNYGYPSKNNFTDGQKNITVDLKFERYVEVSWAYFVCVLEFLPFSLRNPYNRNNGKNLLFKERDEYYKNIYSLYNKVNPLGQFININDCDTTLDDYLFREYISFPKSSFASLEKLIEKVEEIQHLENLLNQ